jgi:hypothetical protein
VKPIKAAAIMMIFFMFVVLCLFRFVCLMMQRWIGGEVCATKMNVLTLTLQPVNEQLGNEKAD